MKTRNLLMAMGMMAVSLTAQASTYYCSPNGNGDGSSYYTPCSFPTGISRLQVAGDTLYLLGGQYDLGNTPINNKTGNANKNIVISGYPGQKAILDFRTTPYGTRGLQIKSTCSYVHVKNLTLRYSGKNNLYNEGSNCRFENLDIYGSADTGCQMKNGGNNLIINVDSHDNFDYQNTSNGLADYGGNADGFADKQHSGGANHYIGCRAWNNSDDGWDFFQRITDSETIIENCICYQNGPADYDMRNHGRYQTDIAWFNKVNGTTITNRYNQQQVVTLEHYPNHGNGNGFKLGGGYTDHKVLVHHCLSVANTVRGFDQNNNDGTMRIFNNTGYNNGYDFGFTTAYGTLTIQNCISFMSKNSNAPKSKTTLANDHNSWNGMTVRASDFVSIDTTLILSARLADGSYPQVVENLFSLPTGSQFIDAGINVGLAFMGTAPDLGWHESDGIIRPALSFETGPQEQTVIAGDSITPIVIKWMGCDNKPNNGSLPTGITRKVSNNGHTLTYIGAITTPGTYTITVTTDCDEDNVSLSFVIRVKPANLKKVAFVTTPGATEDQAMLRWLAMSDSIVVVETDAADNTIDYSSYAAIVIGPKPSSASAGFAALKGYAKPMLVLKPWVFKQGVWSWGTAVNTTDLNLTVQATDHIIFSHLTMENGNELPIFKKNSKYTITGVSDWTSTPALAYPAGNNGIASVMDVPAGTTFDNITLTDRMVVIGVSEYSTADLTDTGLHLIENAIYYLLGMPMQEHQSSGIEKIVATPKAEKIMLNGQLIIIKDGVRYNALGQRVESR